jgi:ATP-dependent DNA helicase RecG
MDELVRLLSRREDSHVEFKAARHSFDRRRDLPDYCAALANEGGGHLILGVREKQDKTGEVTGTSAFLGTHNKLSNELLADIGIRVDVEEIAHPDGRVLIFHVPSKPAGSVIRSKGRYRIPMRAGESLCEMDDLTLRRIMNEQAPDFSLTACPGLTIADLEEKALVVFRERWASKAKRDDYLTFSDDKLLRAAGVLTDTGLNNTALVLFGREEVISERLPDAEIIFEWRQDASHIPHDFRTTWRAPFFLVYDAIWNAINARNSRTPFQQGFIQREIFSFNEKTIREALLNAVAHRDYAVRGQSIFVKASPDAFAIASPGGFPAGITPDNVLYKTYWRNRRIAEVFEKAGLVERSGQGMDDIFQATISDGKGRPDLSRSDNYSVVLSIPARLRDMDFVLFLEAVTNERQISFSFEEILELENIREEGTVQRPGFADRFLELDIIEKQGTTRDSRYILSHRYYSHAGKRGVHTRLSRLSRDKYKQMIIEHLVRNGKGYAAEFREAFRELPPTTIANLLRDLRQQGIISFEGARKTGFWKLTQRKTT